MIVSRLVFDRIGQRADAFFKTDHTTFLKFPDGAIFTFTSHPMRGAPLGIGGAPFSGVSWILVERDGILTDRGSLKDFDVFDPKIETVRVEGKSEYYFNLLEKKVDPKVLRKILEFLKKGKFESVVGLGPGLTPLGDDILSGMVAMGLKVNFPLKTNDISRQQLIDARRGHVPYPVKVFVEEGDDSLLLDMGVSSGIGWAFGITSFLERRDAHGSVHIREKERLL